MANYAQYFNTKKTPQTDTIPGKDMVKNNAGGYVFRLNKWDQFLRFLVLGSEGGSYYATEKNLTIENAKNTVDCIKEDSKKAIDLLLDVSLKGRAGKQDAVIFALALACAVAQEKERPYAYAAISKICRTGTHLFMFANDIKALRGWSRGLRRGIAKFYTDKDLDKLELQIIKYRKRAGFTHKDVMRLAHPVTKDIKRNSLLKYAVGKMEPKNANIKEYKNFTEGFQLVGAYEEAKRLDPKSTKDIKKLVNLITDTGLPREGVPTTFLGQTEVWDALLLNMPINALTRNLGKISSLGMTRTNLGDTTKQIISLLKNKEAIQKSRIHPIQLLVALKMYSIGQGDKGSLSWNPNSRIIDALDSAFYTAFGNVESTGLNHMLALDVSGSMSSYKCAGTSVLSCREASAAMAMIVARVEENHDFLGFTSDQERFRYGSYKSVKNIYNGSGMNYGISQLNISPRQRLNDVIREISGLPFGATDCSIPMVYAEKFKIPVDIFQVYTDNETYAGDIHPKQALDSYRQKMGKDAKLVVVGMAANNFSIADPSDAGMLDVIGFDTSAPNIMREFALGNL